MPSSAEQTYDQEAIARGEKLLSSPEALCNMVRRIALEAGEIVLKYYDGLVDMEVDTKKDDSPVTLADREAEKVIQAALERLTPHVPIVGEEAASLKKIESTKDEPYFWLVDPLDGTKEFINGGDDFTVNIALIKDGVPVMGVVYVPVKGELFAGFGEGQAIRWTEESGKDKPIAVRKPPAGGITVVASKSHSNDEKLEKFLSDFKVEKIIKRGSSLKICAVAMGKADIYPRLGPTCEWDTAAGDAVLRAAGGMMTDTDGKALKYGGSNPKWLNPEFVACSFDWTDTESLDN